MQKRRPPLLYSARKGDGEQPGSVSQGKRGPRVCPATSRTGTSRRVERKSLAPSELPDPLRGHVPTGVTPSCSFTYPQPLLAGGSGPAPVTHPFFSWMLFPSFSPWAYELVLLTSAGAGWTCSGWKACTPQASHFTQKCPS